MQRLAQGGDLRRPRPQLAVACRVEALQQIELAVLKLVERDLDAIAEAQLLAHKFQSRKRLHHRFDVPPVDLQLHGLPPFVER
jgi:hypothetical protein